MLTVTRVRGGRAVLLALVLGGLLVGLVGMHHVTVAVAGLSGAAAALHETATAAMPAQTTPSEPDSHDGEHTSALLHLCLAVLTAVAVLAVVLVLWRRAPVAAAAVVTGASLAGSAPRAPPPTAPQRLALLCVSRT